MSTDQNAQPTTAQVVTLLREASKITLSHGGGRVGVTFNRQHGWLTHALASAADALEAAASSSAPQEPELEQRMALLVESRHPSEFVSGTITAQLIMQEIRATRRLAASLPSSPTPAVKLSDGDWSALLTLIVAHGNGLKNVDGGRTKEEAADWSERYYRLARSIREQTGITDTRAHILPPSSPTAPPLNALAAEIHAGNKKWWFQADGVTPLARNKGELLMLVVTEVAEAMEGERKNLMDDKLPHRRMAEVEIVDAIVRLLDYAAGFGYELDDVLREKLAYNATRADHKAEAERLANGTRLIDSLPASAEQPK